MFRTASPLTHAVSLSQWAKVHPEWWALTVSLAAWAVMLGPGPVSGLWPLCLSPAPDRGVGFLDTLHGAWRSGALTGMLFGWVMMTLAMMPPLAVSQIRHVAVRSFATRRNRAVAAFLGGMAGVWLLIGVIGMMVLGGAPVALSGHPEVAAAAWQLGPMKRAALLRCHRTVPLAAAGWRANWDCLRYGLTHGLGCVGSCWALMLAMTLASHRPVAGLCIQVVALAERRSRRPRFELSALALGICALMSLVGLEP
jgi:predicted metal-binding membrane protein